jgi:hypothetical protein
MHIHALNATSQLDLQVLAPQKIGWWSTGVRALLRECIGFHIALYPSLLPASFEEFLARFCSLGIIKVARHSEDFNEATAATADLFGNPLPQVDATIVTRPSLPCTVMINYSRKDAHR